MKSNKLKKHNKSIKKQMEVLCFLFIMGWIVAALVMCIQLGCLYAGVVSANTHERVERYSAFMEYEFDKIESGLYTLLNEISLKNDVICVAEEDDAYINYTTTERLKNRLDYFMNLFSYIEGGVVLDYEGNLISGTWSDSEEVRKIREFSQPDKKIYRYYISQENKHYLYMIGRIISMKGEHIGEIMLKLNISKMQGEDNFDEGVELVVFENKFIGNKIPDIDIDECVKNIEYGYKSMQTTDRTMELLSFKEASNRFTYCMLIKKSDIVTPLLESVIVGSIILLLVVYMMKVGRKYLYNITVPLSEIRNDFELLEKNDYNLSKLVNIGEDTENEIYIFRKYLREVIMRMDKYVEENYKAACLLKDMQIKQLHAQINPHFLYNTLNILCWGMSEKGLYDEASNLKSLSELLRFSINVKDEKIPLKKELEIVDSYIKINKLHFKDRLNVIVETKDEFNNILIPRFSIQPMLENSIVATMQEDNKDYTIKITIRKLSDNLEVTVMDEGLGFSEEVFEKIKAGMYNEGEKISALYNINERIHYAYGSEYGIFAEKREEMFAVGYIIPIIE